MENTVIEQTSLEVMFETIKSLNTISNLDLPSGIKLETLTRLTSRLQQQIDTLNVEYCCDENGELFSLECEDVMFEE